MPPCRHARLFLSSKVISAPLLKICVKTHQCRPHSLSVNSPLAILALLSSLDVQCSSSACCGMLGRLLSCGHTQAIICSTLRAQATHCWLTAEAASCKKTCCNTLYCRLIRPYKHTLQVAAFLKHGTS